MKVINQILEEMGIETLPRNVRLTKLEATILFLNQLTIRNIEPDFKLSLAKLYYDTLHATSDEDMIPLKDAAIVLNTTIEFIFSDSDLASALTKMVIYDFRDLDLRSLSKKYQEEIKIITKERN